MGKNALISVFDKTNLDLIADFLIKKKYTIYSTGGTSQYLREIKIPFIEISKYTKQKEILDELDVVKKNLDSILSKYNTSKDV